MLGIKIRGVRGSIPTPGPEYLRFGGNTPCIEIRTSTGDRLIFDAGSGIRALGNSLTREAAGEPIHANIFLTHFHWDHIQGIPFFIPLFDAKNRISFFSGSSGLPLQEAIEGQMTKPYFPIHLDQVAAARDFHQLADGDGFEIAGVTVRPFPLNHPQGASGYRIESNGSAIVYATDNEPGDARLDDTLLEYADGADILICDSQYTPETYGAHRGWGHGTWENAVHVAMKARVKKLLLFHHDPIHDDDMMLHIASMAKKCFPNTEAAWEGFTATL